jgi:amidase
VLGAIAGPDARDALTTASGPHLPAGKDYVSGLRVDALHGVRIGFDSGPSGKLYLAALKKLADAGAVLVPVDMNSQPDPGLLEFGVIFNEFKQGLNDYIAHQAGPGLPVTDLTGIIVYNQQHPDRIPYGQDHLVESDAMPGDPVTAPNAGLAIVAANKAAADRLFASNNVEAMVGPSLDYVSIGAAAGYPTVIVPAGYTGHDPQGLSFFGPAWSEPKLLGYAYAYEQASHMRQPPTAITSTLLNKVCSGGQVIASAPAARADG